MCLAWLNAGFMADTLGFKSTFLVGSKVMILGLIAMWLFVKEPGRI